MTDQAIAALVGAAVGALIGFAGNWGLQLGRFHRADREGVRERLAITRGLRSDLYIAHQTVSTILEREVLTPGTRFSVSLWETHGYLLLGALDRAARTL